MTAGINTPTHFLDEWSRPATEFRVDTPQWARS